METKIMKDRHEWLWHRYFSVDKLHAWSKVSHCCFCFNATIGTKYDIITSYHTLNVIIWEPQSKSTKLFISIKKIEPSTKLAHPSTKYLPTHHHLPYLLLNDSSFKHRTSGTAMITPLERKPAQIQRDEPPIVLQQFRGSSSRSRRLLQSVSAESVDEKEVGYFGVEIYDGVLIYGVVCN